MNKDKEETLRYIKSIYGKVTNSLWYDMLPKSTLAPRFYGLPKIHKPTMPLRPIVDGINSPSHELARFLAKLLRSIIGYAQSHVRNSHEFVETIRTIKLEPDEILASFDITSLFTNIPKEKAIELTQERLRSVQNLNDLTKLTVDDIVRGLFTCLSSSYFTYDNKLYHQNEGLAMGSPLSPILADIYMEEFERIVTTRCTIHPKIWIRYVDDTFVIIKKDLIHCFMDRINNIDPHIKFTMETESERGELPFLDCLVQRQADGHLKTTVYRKPTDTGRLLPYSSAHPKHVFTSIIKSAFCRIQRLCSEETDANLATKALTKTLCEFGYPKRMIRHQQEQLLYPQQKVPRTWLATAVIPYKKGTSEAIRKILNEANIRVAFKPTQRLRSILVHSKDQIPKEKIRNCVYNIPCKDCDAIYVGQTNRELGIRIAEHRRLTKRAPRNNEDYQTLIKKSAIALHAFDTGHKVDFDNVKIVKCGFNNNHERLYAETIEISKQTTRAINRADAIDLSVI
ncbi:reverse transcriptase domain-containing protein [Cetobacterium sp.]|uniref:reverse transcriptase domain-containing protein n=1 Tax=Cetobacterium sp. TaxID=2071632 RepID=UPI003EE47ED7